LQPSPSVTKVAPSRGRVGFEVDRGTWAMPNLTRPGKFAEVVGVHCCAAVVKEAVIVMAIIDLNIRSTFLPLSAEISHVIRFLSN
jgi:hypothetical protein